MARKLQGGARTRAKKRTTCLTPRCTSDPATRGLCLACYRTARRMVADKRTTDETLVDAGLMLPSRRGRNGSLFTAAADRKLATQ